MLQHLVAPARPIGLALAVLSLSSCFSPNGKLGDDPALRVEIDRASAFNALEASVELEDDRERRIEERRLLRRFDTLALRLPNDVEVLTAAGALAHRLDDRTTSRRALERAVRADPGYPPAAILFARVLSANGDLDGARAVLSTARSLAPGDGELALATAHVESLAGEHALALEWIDRAAETDVPEWRRESDRGVVLERAGRAIEAEAAFDQARRTAPDASLVPRY